MNDAVMDSEDHEFCMALLPEVSRTFALSIDALPESLGDAVRTAYLLCRIVDSIEDATELPSANREQLFGIFDHTLANDRSDPRVLEQLCHRFIRGVTEPEQRLCRGAGAVFRAYRALPVSQREAISPRVQKMSRGMCEYVLSAKPGKTSRLADLDDLERYCYFVAGTVGELLTDLFLEFVAIADDELRSAIQRRAVSFGLGLQLVNIVKDVAEDHERGICFLPLSLAREYGVTLDHILEPAQRTAALKLIKRVCARAREHLGRAQQYTLLWPVPEGLPVRLFCAVPLALALATLNEVQWGIDTLRRGLTPKVSRQIVVDVLTEARQAAADNHALSHLLAHYSSLRTAESPPLLAAQL